MDMKVDGRRPGSERRMTESDEGGVPFRRPGRNGQSTHEGRPAQPLVGPRLRKALAATTVVVLVAVGLRFAWDQVRSTPIGKAIHAAQQGTKDLFTSEDILRSGPMITGALIRENYLPADGRGYTHRVGYTDRDSLATWTQWATFDAIVNTAVDTRRISEGAVKLHWDGPSSLVYVIRLPEPQLKEPFWVSQPRDLRVDCNVAEALWRFVTINPAACSDGSVYADPHLRWKVEKDFKATALADHDLVETGRRDVQGFVEGLARPFIEPLAKKYGFNFQFQFDWYTPQA